jgi:putative ABC transport system permease protein
LERADIEVAATGQVENARVVMEDHLLMVSSFLLVMSILITAVGGLGLATTMSLAVRERTREFGVMRVVGAQPHMILGIVAVEGVVIGILSCLLAVPLSFPMSTVVGRAFGMIMFQTPIVFMPAPSGIIFWTGLVVLLSAIASVFPAAKATRIGASEALAFE